MNRYIFIFAGGINRTTTYACDAATLLDAETKADLHLWKLAAQGSKRYPNIRDWQLSSVTKYYG